MRLQKQVFVHTRLSRAYLALARLSCLDNEHRCTYYETVHITFGENRTKCADFPKTRQSVKLQNSANVNYDACTMWNVMKCVEKKSSQNV